MNITYPPSEILPNQENEPNKEARGPDTATPPPSFHHLNPNPDEDPRRDFKIHQEEVSAKLSKKTIVTYSFQFHSGGYVSITGIVHWINGEKLRIQQIFRQNFLKNINPRGRGKFFVYIYDKTEELKVKFKKAICQKINSLPEYAKKQVLSLNGAMRDILNYLSDFTGIAYCPERKCQQRKESWNKKLKMKKVGLFTYRQASKMTKNADSFRLKTCTAQSKGHNSQNQGILLKYYDSIEETLLTSPYYLLETKNQCLSKFMIETKICQMKNFTSDQKEQKEEKLLTVKKINSESSKRRKIKLLKQLIREVGIIKQIKSNKEFFLQYYLSSSSLESKEEMIENYKLYMENIPDTLSFYALNNLLLVEEKAYFFQRLSEGIKILHQNGIIHRDLKPDNVLLLDQGTKNAGKENSNLKIIDFSDSYTQQEPYSEEIANSLMYTLPYSPFQCYYCCEAGVKSQKIDSWSLGTVFYQILHGSQPQIFTFCAFDDFRDGARKNEFNIRPYTRKLKQKSVFCKYFDQINLIILSLTLKFKPDQRITPQAIVKMSTLFNQMITAMTRIL